MRSSGLLDVFGHHVHEIKTLGILSLVEIYLFMSNIKQVLLISVPLSLSSICLVSNDFSFLYGSKVLGEHHAVYPLYVSVKVVVGPVHDGSESSAARVVRCV